MGYPCILRQVICWGPLYHDSVLLERIGVTLAQQNPFKFKLKSIPGPSGMVRGELFLCPTYPGQVSCATALGTTTVGMEAPHWPGRDTQVAVTLLTLSFSFLPGELLWDVLKSIDHQQVLYSKIPTKGLPPSPGLSVEDA